jgi:hypothetical protein
VFGTSMHGQLLSVSISGKVCGDNAHVVVVVVYEWVA